MLAGTAGSDDDVANERLAPDETSEQRSLAEDFEALYDDGRTYVEAELAYQKTRARLVAAHGKTGIAFGIVALFMLHMALIGLTVGAILVLSPVIGPLLATASVVGAVLVLTALLGFAAKARFARIAAIVGKGEP